jgi:hypothetical protein
LTPGAASLTAAVVLLRLRPLVLLLSTACTIALAGCTSAPQFVPHGRIEIPVQEGPAPKATVVFGNEVLVHLPAVTTPGHVWTVLLNDTRFLHELRPIQMAPDGTGVAAFLAIREGRRPIRFVAVPPNVRETTPDQGYEITLTISLE